MPDYIVKASFDIDRLRAQLAAMSLLELQVLYERISNGESGALDIFLADCVPATSAGGPDQVIIGLHLAG
jgi:hypothetical protein